jgi:hypothetical protein
MDGTLLKDDKTVAAVDAEAIAAAARHGIAVTLATGRLTTGTLPVARELRLSVPLVCADGAVMVDPVTGSTLQQRSMVTGQAARTIDALMRNGLVPYVFLADSIHCEASGQQHRGLVETWSRDVVVHESLVSAPAWQQAARVVMTLGIGARDAVARSSEYLQGSHARELDTLHFNMSGTPVWIVRSLPAGCDKAEMLAVLAERLQVPAARVAVVGDWLNDLGMFKYAGRSFEMGQSPSVVREAATDLLRSTSATGGGVAEAIEALLSGAALR